MESKTFPCQYGSFRDCDEVFNTQAEASMHLILFHNADPVHRNEDGRYLCHYSQGSRTAVCQETFLTVTATVEHLDMVHKHKEGPIPCPISSDCDSKCISHNGLREHVARVHRGRSYQCPWPGCKQPFGSTAALQTHIKKHENPDKRYPCPRKDDLGCKSTFSHASSAWNHAKDKHDGQPKLYPCPKKKELGCEETFHRKGSAERHAKQKHGSEDAEDDGMFPCPLKEELNCPKTYTDQINADKHSMKNHKGHRYPCPSKDCDEDFSSPVDARKHGNSHGMNNLYPCPAPEGDKCSMMFPTFDEAQRHLAARNHSKSIVCQYCSENFHSTQNRERHEELHTHPFPCPYSWCERRFKTCHEALKHAERQVHNSFRVFCMCNAPDCRTAAMGHAMKPSKLKDHWENHVRLGHVPANSEPSYELGVPRPFKRSPLYEAIYEVNSLASFNAFNRGKDDGVHPAMSADPNLENTEDDDLESMDEDDDLDSMEESSTSFEQDCNLGLLQENSSEYFSQKQRDEMLAQNTQFWENHKHQKFHLNARGRTCLGPGINTQYIVTKPCPFGATIDFDTARLRQTSREDGSKDIVLDTTCAVCSAEKRESTILRTFQSSSKRNVDMDLLREIFGRTLHKRWSAQPSYERVKQRLEEIRKGNQADIKPLILDTEYTIAGQQLMELSFVDLDSGEILINTLVKHSKAIKHVSFSREPSNRKRFLKTSEGHEAKVYSPSRNLTILNVHEIAKKIRKSGITPDSLILVWALSCKDLQLVRGFLEKGGYKNLLPNDDNCIPLVQVFRPHFPKLEPRKLFPLKLDIIFPVMFPGSKLVGRNHEALVDCQQTRLLCKALDWLRKPVKKRGKTWRPETIDGDDYRVSQDFLPDGNVKKRRSSRLQALEANKTESKRLKLCGEHQKD